MTRMVSPDTSLPSFHHDEVPTGTDEWEHSLFDDQRVAEVAADMERYARFWSWVSEHQPRKPV